MRRQLVLIAAVALAAAGALPAAAAPALRAFTIAATGDVLVHEAIAFTAAGHAVLRGAYDFRPLLRPIEPWISDADFALCHLEGTLSPANTGLLYQVEQEHPAYFNAPHEIASALAATGYDACSTAGNHALDRGFAGVQETLDVLDTAGLGHSGTARTPEERRPALYRVRGVQVAHLAYTLGTNEPLPAEAPWAVALIDTGAILADARRAREEGAEFVILSLHWGTEYQAVPDRAQLGLAEALTASADVDLIVGHHAHVVQPIGRANGKVVVYGTGDHLSNIQSLPDGTKHGGGDGVIVHLSVTEQPGGGFAVTGVAVTPTRVDPVIKQVLPVVHTLAYGGRPEMAPYLAASRDLIRSRLGLLGEEVPLSPAPWPSLTCAGRVATIIGTAGPDWLVGTPGDDVIVGRGGGDNIVGGGGDDLICAGDGDDVVWGGPGSDTIFGGRGDDLLAGGDGPDTLHGGSGADRLGGGEDDDTLYGGAGDDVLSGHGGDDLLEAGPGRDLRRGGTGADRSTTFPGLSRLLHDH